MSQPPSAMNSLKTAALMDCSLGAICSTWVVNVRWSNVVSIAAPKIQADLGLSSSGMQWAINSYLLALAALFAFGGRLADTVGHRRMCVLGVIIFAASSALCGLTPRGGAAEAWIVAFRVLQGAGTGILVCALAGYGMLVTLIAPISTRGVEATAPWTASARRVDSPSWS